MSTHDQQVFTDFIKYTRATHVILVVSSLLLMIVTSVQPQRLAEAAYSEFLALLRLNPHFKEWWPLDSVSRAVYGIPYAELPVKRSEAELDKYRELLEQRGVIAMIDGPRWKLDNRSRQSGELVRMVAFEGGIKRDTFVHSPLEDRSIAAIAEFWNFLHMAEARVMTGLQFQNTRVVPANQDETADLRFRIVESDLPQQAIQASISFRAEPIVVIHREQEDIQVPEVIIDINHGSGRGPDAFGVPKGVDRRDPLLPACTAYIPYQLKRLPLNLLAEFLAEFGEEDLPAVDFATAFPSLSRLTLGLESLGIRDMQRHLEHLRFNPDREVALWGAPVPYGMIWRLGPAILALLQIYFLGQLKILSSAYGKRYGKDQPWIGISSSLYSRTLYRVFLLLPLAAVLHLLWRHSAVDYMMVLGSVAMTVAVFGAFRESAHLDARYNMTPYFRALRAWKSESIAAVQRRLASR